MKRSPPSEACSSLGHGHQMAKPCITSAGRERRSQISGRSRQEFASQHPSSRRASASSCRAFRPTVGGSPTFLMRTGGRSSTYARCRATVSAGPSRWMGRRSPSGRQTAVVSTIEGREEAATVNMWAVDIATSPTFRASRPQPLFPASSFMSEFDITPDGKRFVMVQEDTTPPPQQLHLVLNWFKTLPRSSR